MEFRYQAEDAKAASSTYFSPSLSTSNYFSEQAFHAGCFSNGIRRTVATTNLDPLREAIRRELEKEQIRQEIISEEIIRKRVLEAEVRREMAIEQNLGFSFAPTSLHYHPLDNFRVQERVSLSSHREIGDFNSLPFQRHPMAARQAEAKPMNTNFTGIKRKVATIGANELTLGGLKKKPHKEWSCALCKVSATSEQGLNAHLQGRKHKAKEVELMRENGAARKNTESSATLPKNSDKPEPANITISSKPNHEKKPVHAKKENGEGAVQETQVTNEQSRNDPLQGKKYCGEEEPRANGAPGKDIDSSGTLPNSSDKPEMSKISNSKPNHGKKLMKAMKKKNSETGVQRKQITEDFKKRFKLWCEDCQVGCHSATVMADHETGKKHMDKLQAPKQDVGDAKQLVTKNEEPAAEKDQKMEDSKKIFKFWCEDCQISFPNAIVMAGHERGKKHMAKLQVPKRNDGDVKQLVTKNEEPAAQKYKKMEDSKKIFQFRCEDCRVSCPNAKVMADHERGKKHMAMLHVPKQDGGDVKQLVTETEEPAVQRKQKMEDVKKRFKFWCDHCQVGCRSATVMANHERGKRHMAWLQATNQDGGDVQTAAATSTTKTTEATVGKEEAVEEANRETVANVDGGEEPQEKALEVKATVDKVAETERRARGWFNRQSN